VVPSRIEQLVLIEGIGLKTDSKRSDSAVVMLRKLVVIVIPVTLAHASSGIAPTAKHCLTKPRENMQTWTPCCR
jgi:hypothetical protein